MSSGAEQGFCNLECWCHVPTRGVNKPPCYLCVINSCSLSSKPDSTPSAPELSPSTESVPPTFPSAVGNVGAPTIDVDVSSNANRYGWRATISRHSSLELRPIQGNGDPPRNFVELFVQLPPERNETEVCQGNDTTIGIIPIPDPDYPGAFEVNRVYVEGDQQEHNDNVAADTWSNSHAEDSNEVYVTNIEVDDSDPGASQVESDATNATANDLADLIKNLVCNTDEVSFADEEEDKVMERRIKPSSRPTNERSRNLRRRRDKYHSLYSSGLRSLSDPTVSMASQQDVNANQAPRETEYQRLHKIHRRDTSFEAARRYLQSDENLHRTWVREVALRKRNFPRRNRSIKRAEDGNHRSGLTYEEGWRSLQRQLSKDPSEAR